jgi:hypothetical protein
VTLAHPGALWLLALAGPIVAFHLRRRRRVRVVVPSLLAFDPTLLDAAPPRGAGFRPRDLAGLLLEVGALACLSLAAAGPVRGAPPPESRALALVLDGSLSTAAAGRFEEMRALARRALDAAGPGTPATLLLAAGEPRVLATAADPRARVDAALAAAAPAPSGPGALAAAADAAVASGAEVIVLTDGADPEAPALAARADLRLVSVGRPARNRAVVGLVVEPRRDGRGLLRARVLGEDGAVREEDRGALLDAAAAAGARTLRVALDPPGPPDDLPADDAIEIPFDPPRPIRVAVLAPGARPAAWIAAALESCAGLVDRGGSAVLDPSARADLAFAPDAVLALGVPADARDAAVVFGAGSGEGREAPALATGDRTHPVMRGVDPSEWILTRARAVEARAGDAALLQGPEGPIAVAGLRDGRRRVLLGFDPEASTVPLSASWPVLLRNALAWAAGEPEPILLPAPGARRGSLPDAEESRLAPRVARNADSFAPTPRPPRGPGPRRLAPDLALAGAALLLAEALLFLIPAPGAAPRRDS